MRVARSNAWQGRRVTDRAHRRRLCREPQLRQPVRIVSRARTASPMRHRPPISRSTATAACCRTCPQSGRARTPTPAIPPRTCRTSLSVSTRLPSTCRCRTRHGNVIHKFYQKPGNRSTAGATTAFVAGDRCRCAWPWAITTDQRCRCGRWRRNTCWPDNFFMGAFGGSYLNHFWLICACTPQDKGAAGRAVGGKSTRAGGLSTKPESPASVLNGAPMFLDGDVHARRLFGQYDRSRRGSRHACRPRRTAIRGPADPTKHTLPPQTPDHDRRYADRQRRDVGLVRGRPGNAADQGRQCSRRRRHAR